MSETVLVALIALLGTLITVYVGYWQWKRQQSTRYLPAFQNERQAAYRQLWTLLPDMSTLFETEKKPSVLVRFYSQEELNETLEKIKLFLLRNTLYIEEADGWLATQYLEDLLEVGHLISEIESRFNAERIVEEKQHLDYPLDDTNKETSIERWTYKFRSNMVEGLLLTGYRRWQYKAFDRPYSIWSFLVPLLSPEMAWFPPMIRKCRKAMDAMRSTRETLVAKFRQVASGKA